MTENENPVLHTCPSNQLACPTDRIVYSEPTATDNSGKANVTCSPMSGSTHEMGTTLVYCKARDSSGNQAVCSFEVNIPGKAI